MSIWGAPVIFAVPRLTEEIVKVDVEIVSEDDQLMRQLVDSSGVMPHFLQRAQFVGGASCLPLIRSDRPTEFQSADLAGLLADFVALQDVARSDEQRRHLGALIELLGDALRGQTCRARFVPVGDEH